MFLGILIKLNLNAFVLYSIYKDSPAIIGSVHDIGLTELFPIFSTQPLSKISVEVSEVFHTSR